MILYDFSQTFHFTFRNNGEAHGDLLVEVLVEQHAGYDPSVAGDAYKSAWFGTQEALGPMLAKLGFADLDVQGVSGALRSHRDADRRLEVTPNQLHTAGFYDPGCAAGGESSIST